ncbi:hypothetical protein [Streptomyces sp. NPDC057494]|uniref:hypothetical protein n=1 Tax=Streptomyces sp. NPDC057494 TaxID=3346148 RepID=UPI0036824381
MPAEYGPWGRVHDLFRRWQRDGRWQERSLDRPVWTVTREVVRSPALPRPDGVADWRLTQRR